MGFQKMGQFNPGDITTAGIVPSSRVKHNQFRGSELFDRLLSVWNRLFGSVDNDPGYLYGGTVYFTSSGTFTKGDYPGLRAVKVRVQGGGGGGAGCAAAATGGAGGGSGGGGGYAEKWVLEGSLSSSETVTVGAAGSAGGSGGNGGNGGTSSFGSHASATGGGGGTAGVSANPPFVSPDGGTGGQGTAGDLLINGESGRNALLFSTSTSVGVIVPGGGSAVLGMGALSRRNQSNGVSPDAGYGGGASGSTTVTNNARTGAAGRPGIVIVDLFF